MKKLEYWHCYIGPTTRDKLGQYGADAPMRRYVSTAFKCVTGEWPKVLSSGWGVAQEQADGLSFASWDDATKRAIISSYGNWKGELPPYIHAWKLYFEHIDRGKKKKARK